MIADLGQSNRETVHEAVACAIDSLDHLRQRGFGVVAVSFIFDTTRVAVWPDDTVNSAVKRWEEERAKEVRQPTPIGYVGKRRKVEAE